MKVQYSIVSLLLVSIILFSCKNTTTTVDNRQDNYTNLPSDAGIVLSISLGDFKDSIDTGLNYFGFDISQMEDRDSLLNFFFNSFKKDGKTSFTSQLNSTLGRDCDIRIFIENAFDKNKLELMHSNTDSHSNEYRYKSTIITNVELGIMCSNIFSLSREEYHFQMVSKDGEFQTRFDLFEEYNIPHAKK